MQEYPPNPNEQQPPQPFPGYPQYPQPPQVWPQHGQFSSPPRAPRARLDADTIKHYWARPKARVLMVGAAALILVCMCGSIMTAAANAGASANATTMQQQQNQQQQNQQQQQSSATNTPAKPAATAAPKVVLSAKGNGSKKTATFHVDGQWQLAFTCHNTTSLKDFPIFITVYEKDGTMTFNDVTYNCTKAADSGDSSIIHDGGDFYLDINTSVPWTVTVTDIP